METIAPASIQGEGARAPDSEEVSIRTFGAQYADVEIDADTGEVTVLRVVTAHDIGRIINPQITDSQVIGGVIQGVGFAVSEERIVDHALGRVMNPNLEEYKVPTVRDIPAVEHLHIDITDLNANSTGAKGVGEPPLVPTAPAIANAIFDATGVRLTENPFSIARTIGALAEAE
jgi:xanthine dehydrogenase YagR molybdenum-binding subunit